MGEFHIKYLPESRYEKEDKTYGHVLAIGILLLILFIIFKLSI